MSQPNCSCRRHSATRERNSGPDSDSACQIVNAVLEKRREGHTVKFFVQVYMPVYRETFWGQRIFGQSLLNRWRPASSPGIAATFPSDPLRPTSQ